MSLILTGATVTITSRAPFRPMFQQSARHRALTQTLHSFNGSSQDVMHSLETKYLHTARDFTPPPYIDQQKSDIDRNFQLYELCTSISECNKNGTPGPDNVTLRLQPTWMMTQWNIFCSIFTVTGNPEKFPFNEIQQKSALSRSLYPL